MGLSGLEELSEISKIGQSTLINWSRTRPFVFRAILAEAAKVKLFNMTIINGGGVIDGQSNKVET